MTTGHQRASEPAFATSILVGATGMLAGTAQWVAERSGKTVLLARHASRAGSLTRNRGVTTLDRDWRDDAACMAALAEAGALAAPDLAVLWIHGSGAGLEARLTRHLAAHHCLIVKVRGSADLGDLRGDSPAAGHDDLGAARRITVTLGAVPDGVGKRWLTWNEISDGVIAAIGARSNRVVGRLDL